MYLEAAAGIIGVEFITCKAFIFSSVVYMWHDSLSWGGHLVIRNCFAFISASG